MVRRFIAVLLTASLAMASAAAAQRVGGGPDPAGSYTDADTARRALGRAMADGARARARAEGFERQAVAAGEAVQKTARERAALAARVQEGEAAIAAAEARIALIDRQRRTVRRRLSARQAPLIRLTGALQRLSRRPAGLSLLQPGSLRDAVYLRAVLAATLPHVRARTADLRVDLARAQTLEREGRQVLGVLQREAGQLAARRTRLAQLETRQRLASRAVRGTSDREAERALALAEQARDLDDLVGQLDAAGRLRARLAALPGPVLRPADRGAGAAADAPAMPALQATPTATGSAPPPGYNLPVAGRIVSGFGERSAAGVRAEGLTLAPAAGAQVVAPAAGRVAFAGRYRGYGRIVILEHQRGWTSLVTGLARIDVAVGEDLGPGAPLGVAGPVRPTVAVELRRDGDPVNPLGYLAN